MDYGRLCLFMNFVFFVFRGNILPEQNNRTLYTLVLKSTCQPNFPCRDNSTNSNHYVVDKDPAFPRIAVVRDNRRDNC